MYAFLITGHFQDDSGDNISRFITILPERDFGKAADTIEKVYHGNIESVEIIDARVILPGGYNV